MSNMTCMLLMSGYFDNYMEFQRLSAAEIKTQMGTSNAKKDFFLSFLARRLPDSSLLLFLICYDC